MDLNLKDKELGSARIAANAWSATLRHLETFQIIDIHVHPDSCAENVDGPPGYHTATGVKESKGTEFSTPGLSGTL